MTYGNLEGYPLPGTTVIHLHRQDGPMFQDSVEIGTPSKGGAVKVHFDANNLKDAEQRVRTAFYIREIAASLHERQQAAGV